MSNNEITETDVSNFLLAVVLLIVCLIPLSAIVFFDLENNSAALALSTFLLLMALLWVKKKYRKPVENQSAQKRLLGNWKWFISSGGKTRSGVAMRNIVIAIIFIVIPILRPSFPIISHAGVTLFLNHRIFCILSVFSVYS